jgi:hypothetical protein
VVELREALVGAGDGSEGMRKPPGSTVLPFMVSKVQTLAGMS